MKKSILRIFIFLIILLILAFASTWKNRNYYGANFPYIGGLFCHDGDYVEFEVNDENNGFYYMTRYNKEVNLEPYFWNSEENKWVGLGTTLILPDKCISSRRKISDTPHGGGCLYNKVIKERQYNLDL